MDTVTANFLGAFLGGLKLAVLKPLPRLSIPQQTLQTVTIDYIYDPLNRLATADYSNADYYHYAYDAVGNRLSQESFVNGLLSTTIYIYDDADRVSSVDGVNYTFDDNGNLLSDGVNTYVYDSANRLISVTSGQSSVTSYQYNGLGDRISVNGVQYTLDLNAGLTRVLDDGTNTYVYGLGRIAQTNTATEYFLGDALGSVRQLTNSMGEITLANTYEPYGNTVSTFGTGESAYGFTGETTDANGLIYLRARYYNPADARFMSRDIWNGDVNRPLSLNRWNYVKSNPINYTDPSGYFDVGPWCSDNISSRADAAEKYVNRTHAGHLIRDELNTYTAGGIGVQCRGTNVNQSLIGNSGEGIAQVTDNQIKKEYGKKVLDWLKNFRGCGLTYRGEQIHDQNNPAWAAHYMRRVIQQVVKACDKCTSTDKFIAAALAQNGPGFSHFELTQTVLNKKPDNPGDLYRYLTADGKVDTNRPDGVTVNWVKYFDRRNDYGDTYKQLNLFQQVVWELYRRNWYIPNDLNWATIRDVATQ